MTAPLTASERHNLRGNARYWIERRFADLCQVLSNKMMDDYGIEDTARHDPAERFVANRDVVAKAVGDVFADIVRRAYDEHERRVRAELQSLVQRDREAEYQRAQGLPGETPA